MLMTQNPARRQECRAEIYENISKIPGYEVDWRLVDKAWETVCQKSGAPDFVSDDERAAYLICFADRACDLAAVDAEDLTELIASTRASLIPAARKLGARYFEILLSDLCMQYDGEEHAEIRMARDALTKVSGCACARFDEALDRAVESQSVFSVASARRPLLGWELKQQLEQVRDFERSRLDLWEIILTCRDRDSHKMLAHFLELYRAGLREEEIFPEYAGQDKDAVIVRLQDRFENNYRVVLLPESRLQAYFIGDAAMMEEETAADARRPQITVYSYTPGTGYRKYAGCIPSGATALDFAFHIDPALAVTANGAHIRRWKGGEPRPFAPEDQAYPLKTVLSDGDVVQFDAGTPHATLDWFSDVNTERGRNCLIRYFKEKYSA